MINAIDVQGTRLFLLDVPNPEWADCEAFKLALMKGIEVLCPQLIGELTRSRPTKKVRCMHPNMTKEIMGVVEYGQFSMEMFFDHADVLGQKKLTDAFDNKTPIVIVILSPDWSAIFTYANVMKDGISFPDGSKVGYSVTVSPFGGFHRCFLGFMDCIGPGCLPLEFTDAFTGEFQI